jgi:hypothetical protein
VKVKVKVQVKVKVKVKVKTDDRARWPRPAVGDTVKEGMAAHSSAHRAVATLITSWALVGLSSCGGGTPQILLLGDAAVDAADAPNPVDDAPDVDEPADTDALAAPDAESEAPSDAATDAATLDADATPHVEAGDTSSADAVKEAGPDVAHDAPVEHAPATATWTIDPNAACSAAGAGCMDTGAVGGYEITASGSCPTASSLQLYFPGGTSPVPAATYAVKPAAGVLDVISMPAGKVGILVERDDAAKTHFRYWGRSGSVTVTAVGAGRRLILTGVSIREETSSAVTTLGADVSCP